MNCAWREQSFCVAGHLAIETLTVALDSAAANERTIDDPESTTGTDPDTEYRNSVTRGDVFTTVCQCNSPSQNSKKRACHWGKGTKFNGEVNFPEAGDKDANVVFSGRTHRM